MGDWYKEWYIATEEGEAQMRAALSNSDNGEQNRNDICKRYEEMRAIDESRCAISRDQIRFIEKILASS